MSLLFPVYKAHQLGLFVGPSWVVDAKQVIQSFMSKT